MSVAYREPSINPEEDAVALRARFRLRNRSRQTWRSSEGFRVGAQIFDRETNLFIEDGPRVSLETDVGPGAEATVELRIELPNLNGRYRVFISAMVENVCWYYGHGWPFLVADVVVDNRRAGSVRSRVMTERGLRRELFLRSIRRAFSYPFLTGWRNRSLIRSMTRRDILSRYRGSFGGLFWTLLNPLLLMVTYFFVFGVVLRTRFGDDPSRSAFVLYFLAGMLPWLPFSEAAGRAPFVMLEHRNFVKRLVFPLETLPVNQVVAGLVTQVFALGVFLVLRLIARGAVPITVLWLPVLLAPQVLFTLGICWFLAALGVYFRDLGQINGFVLTLWFFLTPICYPETSLPAAALNILSKNPLFVLVRGFRAILLEETAPAFGPMWKLWLVSAAVFFLGHAWFYKLRKSFADVI